MTQTKHHILSALLIAMTVALFPNHALAGGKSSLWSDWPKDSYYKDYPLFHWYPDENATKPQSVYRFGPVGIGIDLTIPAFGMKVKNVEEGSPASTTGKLKLGQIIESINGKTLKDIDPRVFLGNIITQAEAADGKVTIMIKESMDSRGEPVLVRIPVLGAYSKTWPLNCPKSDKIVRGVADFLANNGNPVGALGHDQGLLFLLSTGEEKDLEVARRWVKQAVDATKDQEKSQTIPWAIGYGAPAYCEYYLRTGDESVLPLIKKIADQAARLMYNGAWNHRTIVNFKYGHMNAAGVHCVKFLMLAKECGVDVDEYTLQTSLRHFFRYAGRGNVPYGDSLPEGGFVDNGKVGGLAFAMAAAASLTPEGEDSVYAKARDACAVKGFYSTSWMLHGHTGGGIGEVWRSSAMSLMYDKKPTKFREFMDNRTWHLDLSRRFNGAMTVLADTDYSRGYDNEMWGSGYAMTYTVPRKTLRMTGAPPSKYSKKYQLPARPWGTEADDAFYSLAAAPASDGKVIDMDAEKLATDASWPILRELNQDRVTDEMLLLYAGHQDYNVRQMAAERIRSLERDKLIPGLLEHPDPRLREVGISALLANAPSNTGERVNKKMAGHLLKMIADPNESWWVVQKAMMALSLTKPERIEPGVNVLLGWLNHDEWWIQRAAIAALAPLATDHKLCPTIVPAIANVAAYNTVREAMSSLPKIATDLSQSLSSVQKIAKESFLSAYERFPAKLSAPGGADMQNAVPYLQGDLAAAVVKFPGGFDDLFRVGRKIMPDEALPYKHLYFKEDFKSFGPDLTKLMPTIILEDVIPEYLGENMDAILDETRWATAQEKWKRAQFAVGALDEMVALYKEIGIKDYDWHVFGPERDNIRWDYYSYDAPDVVKNQNANANFYIDDLQHSSGKTAKAEAEASKLATALQKAKDDVKTALAALAKDKNARTQADVENRKKTYEGLREKAEASAAKAAIVRQGVNQAMLAGKLPKDMEHWFALDFNPTRAKWKRGLAPFANTDGKAVPVEWRCVGNFCGCGEPPRSLWEKDVLLMRSTISLPPLKPDHRYRVLLGGNIHSKAGGPVTVYINGRPVHQQGGFGGRLRGNPRGFFIDKALASEFAGGKVLLGIAAIKPQKAYLSAWIEEMKMPPSGQKEVLNAISRAPMMSSEWQEMQDPDSLEPLTDPNEGKYRYNGKFIENPRVRGEWKLVDQVREIADFTKPRADNPFAASADKISFLSDGKTSNANWIWTSNMLMALDRKEALLMSIKAINGREYLFLESGGFSPKHPKGWQTPITVLEKTSR